MRSDGGAPHTTPPRLLTRLLASALPRDRRGRSILGDLLEEWHERPPGLRRTAWYALEVARLAVHYVPVPRNLPGVRGIASRLDPRPYFDAARVDAKLSLRISKKYPGLTAVMVLALALGIPASLVPLHVLNVIDQPLPVPEGDRIVALRYWDTGASRPADPGAPDYFRWRDHLTHFDAVGASAFIVRNARAGEDAILPLRGSLASASLFEILGAAPLLGRPLQRGDEAPGAQDVVVLGYDAWQSLLGGAADAVGRQVRFGRSAYTVVGVMPEGFTFPWRDQFWIPLRPASEGRPDPRHVQVLARLDEGASRAGAEAEFQAVLQRVLPDVTESYPRYRGEVVSVVRAGIGVPQGASLVVTAAQALSLVMLALACGCVGLLVLARTMARQEEFSIRSAIGASRTRIVGQLFIETILLALLATGLGLALADAIAAGWQPTLTRPDMDIPTWIDFGVKGRTATAALVLGVSSAVFASVLPGLRATGGDPHHRLVSAGTGSSGIRFWRGSTVLIPAMVALCVACLAVGASLAPGLFRDRSESLGIDGSGYLAAEFWAPPAFLRESDDDSTSVRASSVPEEFRRRLDEVPGLSGVVFARVLPGMDWPTSRIEVEGQSEPSYQVAENEVFPGYFRALHQAPLAGRGFELWDLEPPRNAVIVNTAFVERVLGGRNALGQRFRPLRSSRGRAVAPEEEWLQIVGVVDGPGIPTSGPARGAGFYRPLTALDGRWVRLAVHVGPNPTRMTQNARAILAEISPTAMIRNPTALSNIPSSNDLERELWLVLAGVVVAVAGVLGVSGLYALVSFTVERRTLEIGIRRALGAPAASVVLAVAGRAALQLCAGLLVGAVLGAVGVRTFAGSIWVDAPDWPGIVAALALGGLVMGLSACVLPTLKGLRITPSDAFRASRGGTG